MATAWNYSRVCSRAPRRLASGAGLFAFALAAAWIGIQGATAFATDFSSSNFIVRDPVSAGGGGFATSSSFQLWSSFSQNAPGKSTSASNELQAGFLYFVGASSSEPPPPPPGGGGGSSGGGGSGSVTTPIPPPPPGIIPGIIPPLLSIIFGDQIPPLCIQPGINRSDFNCDGDVDLRDLSILLTRPKFVTGRVLSYLFSDWTRRLPIPSGGEGIASAPGTASPGGSSGFAQVQETLGSETGERAKSSGTPKGFFRFVWGFLRTIGSAILRLFGF